MANKKDKNLEKEEIFKPIETLHLTQDKPLPTPTPKVSKDPYREKVIALREKGYDNNQIASMLMIHKQTVDNIK